MDYIIFMFLDVYLRYQMLVSWWHVFSNLLLLLLVVSSCQSNFKRLITKSPPASMGKNGTGRELSIHIWGISFSWRGFLWMICAVPHRIMFCISEMLMCPGFLLA